MTRTREEHIEVIRAKCVEANPDLEFACVHCGGLGQYAVADEHGEPTAEQCGSCQGGGWFLGRPIRLADVLVTMEEDARDRMYFTVSRYGELMINDVVESHWDCRKDDLTEQTDECLSFLASLLTNRGEE